MLPWWMNFQKHQKDLKKIVKSSSSDRLQIPEPEISQQESLDTTSATSNPPLAPASDAPQEPQVQIRDDHTESTSSKLPAHEQRAAAQRSLMKSIAHYLLSDPVPKQQVPSPDLTEATDTQPQRFSFKNLWGEITTWFSNTFNAKSQPTRQQDKNESTNPHPHLNINNMPFNELKVENDTPTSPITPPGRAASISSKNAINNSSKKKMTL